MNYVILKDKIINTVPAITEDEHMTGLMFKDSVPDSMSFLFTKASINKFWMHNTKIPLDILFCNNNKIIDICSGVPYSKEYIGPNLYSNLVVELPKGYCEKNQIRIGDNVRVKLSISKLADFFEIKLKRA